MSVDFLDTNVFVYLFDETDARKRGIARELVRDALQDRNGRISYQVVQETLNIITRKLAPPVNSHDAGRFLDRVLSPLWHVMPVVGLYHRGLEIQGRYGYGFYDALIVASALEGGCTRLYTEDLQHGQQIGGLRIENPFLA